tara:strand:- start:5314 stop:5487 length:174 start_codon:yes stop_codon:yes gene_type:complete
MNKLVSKDLYKKRIYICKECPSYNSKLNNCKECGCFLLVKAALTITDCPLGKWKNEN